MNPFQDRWSRWHDKVCPDGRPSSNNGWIYTAYAVKLGLPVSYPLLIECLKNSFDSQGNLQRSPGQKEPPMSRDEILGLCFLKLLDVEQLIKSRWLFSPYSIPPFKILRSVRALLRMKGVHRNKLWRDGGEPDLFRFAFSVPLTDRAFIYRCSGQEPPLIYRAIESIDKLLAGRSHSGRMIRFLKYNRLPEFPVVRETFTDTHPFYLSATFSSRSGQLPR